MKDLKQIATEHFPDLVAAESLDAVSERLKAALPDIIEGMAVSVDVSTNDDDSGHRYFGTVTELMEDDELHGYMLLVQDAAPNFKPQENLLPRLNEWRNLALQFDGHRMQAIGLLKALLSNYNAFSEDAQKFLAQPPLPGEKVLAQKVKEYVDSVGTPAKIELPQIDDSMVKPATDTTWR